jgi:2-dehydro-3-deoxyphosphooctonate aldolase (KDO 8-P synthase)
MNNETTVVGNLRCGGSHPLLLIAGPCVIESEPLARQIAEQLKSICTARKTPLIFKASFDKANRTSLSSWRGPGLEEGLRVLETVRREFELPVTTDIHESHQAGPVAEVCDLLQIPAFLARQTDLLVAAARTGKAVNVKKGQFMAPNDMKFVVQKLRASGCNDILLTERGTFFGYGKLVNDFAGVVQMRSLGVPVVFDATHSVQQPGGTGGITLGNRDMVAPLARAAVAVGVDAVFLETHPQPDASPSDAANLVPLDQLDDLLTSLLAIRECLSTHLQTP